ncbi:glycosyltransferase [Sphingobacterium sp. 2149]|uniref:glycosyltransferase n=1 Tax=Sphingobacterium sp. 2149 TaxID=2817763 RepID=UPI001AE7F88B|nr:glycosyltransferase [Sphingobacterium sp. 2149]MDR6736073.1 cellulose synthase/poly-beta-1,6-N-acetylglucosamine synthase-like glycosyltransferase/spore germination protein YaaH/peptidoglycan/xylan/chitin deacetylase (PgdA/CDA1 family) [Sphingobacterium sp. 2149]
MSEKQIFQTSSKKRWYAFSWMSRALVIGLIIGVIGVVYTLGKIQIPPFPTINTNTPLTEKSTARLKKSKQFKEFTILKSELEKIKHDRDLKHLKHIGSKSRINMGFYVSSWSNEVREQSLSDLRRNIGHLDMVAMESFFTVPNQDTVVDKADTAALKVIHKYKRKAIAQISNFSGNDFDGQTVKAILVDPEKQQRFIDDILLKVKRNGFGGINIDFENLQLDDRKTLNDFMAHIYTVFHTEGLLVSQDISPENDDYDPIALQKYNDYIILMAYDQHSIESNAGAISHQAWVEKNLDELCSKVDADKVILALACYGYDWPKGRVGQTLTYDNAVILAHNYNAKIAFDPESANLSFSYTDGGGMYHDVYFTDAATYFNLIRKADDWGLAGIALWRLGSEDARLWSFISRSLSQESLKKDPFDFGKIQQILVGGIQYIGDGEILDLVNSPAPGEANFTYDPSTLMVKDQKYVKTPSNYVIKRFGERDNTVVLTFDDGPDPTYTPQVLDILKKEHVPGAFFLVGVMAEKNMDLVRREYQEGHEIGNHTFFHPDMSTIGPNRVKFELNATRKIIECITGHSTILFRAPFNADAEPQTVAEILPVAQSRKENYINIGEYIDPNDWLPGRTADEIYNEVVKQRDNGNIILLHDAGGNREATIAALPRIIHYFKSHGYKFATIGDLMGKKRDELMPPVKNASDSGFSGSSNRLFLGTLFYGNIFLNLVFSIAIVLAIFRTVMIAYLAIRQKRRSKKERFQLIVDPQEKVSVIIPAYNEEITVLATIQSLLNLDYPDYELVFVDDGSKDKTFELVSKVYGDHPKVRLFTKQNGGKASALNYGIQQSQAQFVLCIDADTQLKTDALKQLMKYFNKDQVAAVAGSVKVGNVHNILTHWQSIEYITSQNMDRRAFDLLNMISVVPGAIGAFRKSAVLEVGGFTTDTLAEDCDLTMRILKAGYIVRNASEAIAYTEAPDTVGMLFKQRFRWSFGVLQSFWKNKQTLLNPRYGYFGMVGMPNILIFQIILPLFAPLADIFMLFSLVSGLFSLSEVNGISWTGIAGLFSLHTGFGQVMFYYFLFVVVDIFFAAIAFKLEGEKLVNLIYLFPQRFFWRQLMYFVLFKSVRKAIKGELNTWGTLKRTGGVKQVTASE